MSNQTKAYIALIFICIVWGTTYLAIRMAVLHYPAFLLAAIRQLVSGAIIMAIGLMMSRKTDWSRSNLMHQAMIGFLLITMGNGLVTWGEKYVPSGVAALICSLMPIIAVLTNLVLSRRDKPNVFIVGGMIIGFLGVGLIFKDDVSDITNSAYLLGIVATFVATSSWAIGSVLNKKGTSKINPVFNSGLQLGFGGLFLLAGSPLIDDYSSMNLFHPEVIWPLVYLIIFGSVLAYTAYMFTLKVLPVGIVTMYAYVNPLVAVILGYLVLNEPLTWFTALSFISIMAGVTLVNYGYRKQHKEKDQVDFGNNAINALPNTKSS
ncbi:MAG: EamA family transporter [Sphingobacteriales bacterium]|nr:MAG: EamA family transporter [Sphingobacteriales bacterium]